MKYLKIVIPISLLSLVLFFCTYKRELSLFPHNETQFEFIPITNSDEYISATSAEMDVEHGHLHFRYTLDSTIENPYAVLLLHAHELQRKINLSSYDELVVEIDPEECTDFTVTLYLYEKNISDYNNMETHRPLSIKCRTQRGKSIYRLPLQDFATPHEWFRFMKLTPEEVSKPSWSAMTHLAFTHFDDGQTGVEQAITISGLRFRDDPRQEVVLAVFSGIALLALLFPFCRKLRKRKNLNIKRRIYYSNEVGDNKVVAETLLNFFHEEFSNPLFSLQMIEKKIGLKPVVVNDLLASEIGSSYKQYLNTLRIDKAKYLLVQSDLPIATIASEVGYCYANSFSRAFRNIVGITPQSFRQEKMRNKTVGTW